MYCTSKRRRLTSVIVDVEFAVFALARNAPKALEFGSAQGVEPFVPRRVLNEAGLVAEAVVAIFAHAVEVRLMFAVVATGEAAILVEPIGRRKTRKSSKIFICSRLF